MISPDSESLLREEEVTRLKNFDTELLISSSNPEKRGRLDRTNIISTSEQNISINQVLVQKPDESFARVSRRLVES
jgi:hypothetical protein